MMITVTRVMAVLAVLMFGFGSGVAGADTGTSNGATYTVSTTPVDLGAGWQVVVGQLSGGDPGITTAFNSASTASGKYMGTFLDQDHVQRADADFQSTPVVSFRPTAVSQVLTGTYYQHGAAHPLDFITTVVIDSRSGRPITLDQLFTDPQAGYNRLSEQTKLLLPTVLGQPAPMAAEPANAPVAGNFRDWIPTAAGLEIHFEDYQFGHGLPVITVPWSALTNLMAPGMRVLAQ